MSSLPPPPPSIRRKREFTAPDIAPRASSLSKFVVKGPDGSTYNVTAPEGTTPAQALARVKAQATKATPKPKATPAPRSGWQTTGDFFGDVVDNVLPNWGDELTGGMDAIGAVATGKPVGEAYSEGKKTFRRNQAQYDRDHPNLAWASTIAGVGGGLVLPGGAALKGASLGAKALQGAKIGAAYGALSGAGEGDGIVERGANALRSGVIGAGGGAIATPLALGAARGGRVLRNSVPGLDAGMRQLARVPRAVMGLPKAQPQARAVAQGDRMAANAMNDGHIQRGMGDNGPAASPQAIAAEVESRQALNVPAIPGDVTQPMHSLTSWASRGMGRGQTLVRERLDARKAQEAARVRQHVIETTGPVSDPILQMEQHMARAKTEAAPKYEEAYAQPMTLTPDIQGIMKTPAFADAVPQAIRNIRNAQRDPEAMGLRLVPNPEPGTMAPDMPHVITPKGMLVLDKNLSTEGFDQVVRAMRDNGRSAMNTTGFRPVDTTNSVHINNRARDLRSALADQNPAYADVTSQYADDLAQRDAFTAGQDVGKVTGHEINAQARSMPESAQPAWAIGARTAMADEASQFGAQYPTGDTARAVDKMLGDQPKRDAIGSMMGNDGALSDLSQRLEAEHQGNILWREVNGNSKTASRQSLDADLDAATGANAASLNPKSWVPGIINHLADKANGKFRNAVKDRVSQIVTESDPKSIEDLMAQIVATAEKDADFAQLLHRSGIVAAKGYSQNIEPVRADDNYDAEGNPL